MSKKQQYEHGIPFALHQPTGRMVSAVEVKKGLACGCVCVACQSQLIARKGEIRTEHFAHYRDSDCPYAAESAIHWMAKQLIAERGMIFAPYRFISKTVSGKRNLWTEEISVDVQQEGLFEIEDCRVEQSIAGESPESRFRRPDLIASFNGVPLAIEICNTHAVDLEKSVWLENRGFSVLEINVTDLASLPAEAYRKALEERLFTKSNQSHWLVHIGDIDAQKKLDQIEQELRIERRPEEERLLILIEAEETARKREEEKWAKELKEREEARKREAARREQERDVEEFKFTINNCTVRVGRNAKRVTLKAHGYPTKDICLRISALARRNGGRYVSKIFRWEFYRNDGTKSVFDILSRDVIGLTNPNFFDAPKPPSGSVHKASEPVPSPISDSPPLRLYFDDPNLQELFDERAGVLEYEGGLDRVEAEQQALAFVNSADHTSRLWMETDNNSATRR